MHYARIMFIMLVMVAGCGNGVDGEDVVEKSSFQMPVKENTWVRKETLRKSKEDLFSDANKAAAEVPIDSALAAELNKLAKLPLNTQQECSEQANALDKTHVLANLKNTRAYWVQLKTGQIRRKAETQSHRSKGRESYDSGVASETKRIFQSAF